jgi:anti-anti-sigma factor
MDFQNEPITVTHSDGDYCVKLLGPIHTNVAWIETEFKKVIAAKPKNVDLDLAETSFLSSTGVGCLVWLYNGLKAEGATLRIVKIQKRVLSTLDYSRLTKILQVQPTAVVDK